MPRKQAGFEQLGVFPKFLHHLCSQRSMTQTELWRAFARTEASPSTINRWFRGLALPSAENLARLARLLETPLPVLKTLRTLDDMGYATADALSTISLLRGICTGSPVMMLGFSMHAGTVHLRALADQMEDGHFVLVMADNLPTQEGGQSSLERFEHQFEGSLNGMARLYWLSSLFSLVRCADQNSQRPRFPRMQMYVTDFPPLVDRTPVEYLVANRWLAIHSQGMGRAGRNQVYFFNSPEWNRLVEPLMDRFVHGRPRAGKDLLVYDNHPEEGQGRVLEQRLHVRAREALRCLDRLSSILPGYGDLKD